MEGGLGFNTESPAERGAVTGCNTCNHPNLSMAVTVVTLNVAPSERSALVSALRATGRREKLLVDHL